MGFGNLLKLFQPKDKVFFVLFEKVTQNLVEMSKFFHDGIQEFDQRNEEFLKKISDYEHINDDLTHQIFVELGRNFITPLDREDISTLSVKLDDIADYMYASAKYIYLYKTPVTKEYGEFSLLIYKACLEIQKAISNLKDFRDTNAVKESCIKINSFENLADDVQSKAMIKLFETNDPIMIIKVKSVLSYLEEVTDKAEDVASTLDHIIVKYA